MGHIKRGGGPVSMAAWEAHCGRAPLYVDLDAFTPEEVTFAIHGFFARLTTAEPDKIGLDLLHGGKLKFSPGRVETGYDSLQEEMAFAR